MSSAGFGGINTHVVLDAGVRTAMTRRVPRRLVPVAPEPVVTLPDAARRWSAPLPEWEPFLISADDLAALDERLGDLSERCPAMSEAELHDLAATLTAHDRARGALRARRGPPGSRRRHRAQEVAGWDTTLLVDEPAESCSAATGVRRSAAGQPRARARPAGTLLPVPRAPDAVRLVDGSADTAIAQPAWCGSPRRTGLAAHLGCTRRRGRAQPRRAHRAGLGRALPRAGPRPGRARAG
ncbi:hypothetical protein BBK82_30815 [Lentzea guizhouensis]|uniref:Uncharacterized protein n=1 Tax=Lentzea guizhouensis TaxID=1586287 RepID=A0A1B2HPX2_9PSEU|nr:hypothetical protein [Lentzea guizhouensis]ANZ39779.1 hypothetical protein BBK82_30815 [Lentzea guizhouensis]